MKTVKEAKRTVFRDAIKMALTPIVFSLFIQPIRFTLEYIGLPEEAIFLIGLLWLTIAFSIYWGIRYHNKERFLLLLLLTLLIYSPVSRIPVALAWWADTHWALGTHYGLYFNTFGEALFNQVFYGTMVQAIPGFLAGGLTVFTMRKIKSNKLNNTVVHHE